MEITEKKTDLRIKKTYTALENAFIALMEKKSFDEISVQELCDLAVIRRTTFYKHFSDKYEYLDYFIRSIRDELICDSIPAGNDSLPDFYLRTANKIITWFKNNEIIVRRVLQSNGQSLLKQMTEELIYNDVLNLLKQSNKQEQIEPEIYASFISGGVIQVAHRWITGEIHADEEELTRSVCEIMSLIY